MSADRAVAIPLVPSHQDQSTGRRVLRAAASVTAAGVVVKLAAMFKEVVVASAYGRSDAMDAFLVAFLIPNLLINLIAESMNQALIPTLIRVRLQQGQARAQQLLSTSMLATSSMLIAVSVAMGIFARLFFPFIGANFTASKLTLSIHLFYALLPCVVLGGIASNCTAVLNTLGRFTWPALAPLIVSACIVFSTLALRNRIGIWALVIATVVGTALQAGVLAAGMHTSGYALQLRWPRHDEASREVAHQFAPVLLSSIVASGGLLVDQAMAAMLPAGSVSALVFAGRFVSVAITLLAGSLATAVAPYFSELAARRDWPACRVALRVWSFRSAAVSVPIALALILGAHPLVRLTLQHGAFTAHDTAAVASTLAMYAVQIPFFVVSRVFYRFVVAMRRTDLIFYCGAINLALDIALNLVLMRFMGVAGIALSTSFWTVSTCLLFWYWSRRLLTAAEPESAHP
ncbi:murein biosynthesis integral membrane protein MurJ [Occallatibacter riparius]|uniref:MATE family efflux transporter n=1 Tax=Occallatibacter riparius TaxID=1002689 RepID=A0A9J7BK10_9BACT|nr:lipid II flippase MurJ [Occallatibacter riparius]UWZ82891.1 MATE family efflux transporter [Occallatibacter riparius]